MTVKFSVIFILTKTDEIENIIAKIRDQYPDYRFEYSVKEEKDWRAYFEVLYPSPDRDADVFRIV